MRSNTRRYISQMTPRRVGRVSRIMIDPSILARQMAPQQPLTIGNTFQEEKKEPEELEGKAEYLKGFDEEVKVEAPVEQEPEPEQEDKQEEADVQTVEEEHEPEPEQEEQAVEPEKKESAYARRKKAKEENKKKKD